MNVDVHVVNVTNDMKNELSEYFDSLLFGSEIFKQRSKEAALRYALEKRVPDRDEYYELMNSIIDDVRENDETIEQKMREKFLSMTLSGNNSEITAAVLNLMKLLGKDIKITDEESQLH